MLMPGHPQGEASTLQTTVEYLEWQDRRVLQDALHESDDMFVSRLPGSWVELTLSASDMALSCSGGGGGGGCWSSMIAKASVVGRH